MTTEEQIAALETWLNDLLDEAVGPNPAEAFIAAACELRALRLMLRDEIREAAWRLAAPGQPVTYTPTTADFLEGRVAQASRKAPPPEPKVRLEDRP